MTATANTILSTQGIPSEVCTILATGSVALLVALLTQWFSRENLKTQLASTESNLDKQLNHEKTLKQNELVIEKLEPLITQISELLHLMMKSSSILKAHSSNSIDFDAYIKKRDSIKPFNMNTIIHIGTQIEIYLPQIDSAKTFFQSYNELFNLVYLIDNNTYTILKESDIEESIKNFQHNGKKLIEEITLFIKQKAGLK